MRVALWAEIHRLYEVERLSRRSISRRLHCSGRTINKALSASEPPLATPRPRGTILDPYKDKIKKLIELCPELSAIRVLEEIEKEGYQGEVTLIRRYLREVRPSDARVYQEVEYPPAKAMQVDFGDCGTCQVGECRRKIYVFVAVLCYSRLMYIEFTLSQTKATFYRAIVNALRFFQGATNWLIVDNLKAAVLKGSGRDAVFHPEFRELCGYHRMEPIACQKRDPETKGTVEGGVRYVKHNALKGRKEELVTFDDYQRLAVYWRDSIANVRNHETTAEKPVERFEKEREELKALPLIPYDTDDTVPAVVSTHARVRFETNRYSVPPEFVRKQVILRANDLSLWVLHCGKEIARHRRSFEKRRLIVDLEHRKAALARRKRSQGRLIEAEFDALSPEAEAFRRGLERGPRKTIVHLRRLLELVRLYGKAEVCAAIATALEYEAFDSAYVQNLIDQERRRRHLPSPLPITPRRRELLEDVQLEEPDPGKYDKLLE